MFTSREAQGDPSELELFDMFGTYDLQQAARAYANRAQLPTFPLRSDLLGRALEFNTQGALDAQGIAFFYEQYLGCYRSFEFQLGADFLFLYEHARQDVAPRANVNPGQSTLLFDSFNTINQGLGITEPTFTRIAPGDLDIYLRMGKLIDYWCKCKRIDIAAKFGVIAPTSTKDPLTSACFVPTGGNGHWGIYASSENEFELRDDLIVGFWVRAIKRIAKNKCARMPIAGEPWSYGALIDTVWIDPGATFVFSPYLSLEDLRDGFGLRGIYTLVVHRPDTIEYLPRPASTIIPDLSSYGSVTSWNMEHVSLCGFYDFAKYANDYRAQPRITLSWDIPFQLFGAKRCARTDGISLMIEADF